MNGKKTFILGYTKSDPVYFQKIIPVPANSWHARRETDPSCQKRPVNGDPDKGIYCEAAAGGDTAVGTG